MHKRMNMRLRRTITLVLSLLLTLSFISEGLLVTAEGETDSGREEGSGIGWEYDGATKTLTFSGKGRMADNEEVCSDGYTPDWDTWSGEVEAVVFEEGITYIGWKACYGMEKLTRVELPESLKTIGGSAFEMCVGLSHISFPKGLKKIEESAFAWCGFTKVVLPPGLESLGEDAFLLNPIEEFTFPAKIKKIAEGMFCGSDLKKITIPKGVTSIGPSVFEGCLKLEEAHFPEGIKKISYCMFSECYKLTSFRIPNSVKIIENNAFDDSGLKSIVIPKNVERIEDVAFGGCKSLKKVVIRSKKLKKLEHQVFSMCKSLKTVKIPSSVQSLESEVFYYSGIETITIPKNVTSIGKRTFIGCKSLTSITFSGTKLKKVGKNAFKGIPKDCVIKVPKKKLKEYKKLFRKSGLSSEIKVKGV